MTLVWGLLTFLAGIAITAILGDLFSEEIRGRLELLPYTLIRLAVRRLPPDVRDDLAEEWAAELHVILRGTEALPITRLYRGARYALGLLRAAKEVGHLLSGPPSLPIGDDPADAPGEPLIKHLPNDVRDFYADAIRVLDAGAPDVAAVQLRRTLEAAVAHVGIGGGPLFKRIEVLIDQGLVAKPVGALLHQVRMIGNVGAHASEVRGTDVRVSEESARKALRLTTLVLRDLFDLPGDAGVA
jgi:hypothetical protein